MQTSLNNGKKVNMHNKTLCFVAGRSGGHILPALTLAKQHKADHPHDSITFFSTSTPLDIQLIGDAHVVDHHIPMRLDTISYSNPFRLCTCIYNFFKAMITSFFYMLNHKPTAVISTGGYISIPVCVAAYIVGIPITLYELNAIPGKAARAIAPMATTICLCFPQARSYFAPKKSVIIPYPIRFNDTHKAIMQSSMLAMLGFAPERTTIFALGGSQGSLFINQTVKRLVEQYPQLHGKIQIIHQTGMLDTTNWQAFYAQYHIPARVFTYHDKVEQYYQAADLIICRSGAGTLWEIAFFGKHAITIPIVASTTNHQEDNARAFAALYPTLCTVMTQNEIEHTGLNLVATQLEILNHYAHQSASL